MDLEDIILSEVMQSQKNTHDMHSLIAQKFKIPKIRFAKHMKLKNEDQSVDTLPFLELGTKHPWKELQRQSLELRGKDEPSTDFYIQGSIL